MMNSGWREGDELLVIGDTHTEPLENVAHWVTAANKTGHFPFELRWYGYDAGRHAWGHPQINYGMKKARGDYLVFQDDDDRFAPSAGQYIHNAVRHLKPPRPVVFKFFPARFGYALPRGQNLVEGGVGGHCLVVPNIPEKLGKWSDRYEGDWDFIEETLRLWEPDKPVFRQEVITYAR